MKLKNILLAILLIVLTNIIPVMAADYHYTMGCPLGEAAQGWACTGAWLICVLIFFGCAVARRQLTDNFQIDFSMFGGTILGIVGVFLIMSIIADIRISLIIGLVGAGLGGILAPKFELGLP